MALSMLPRSASNGLMSNPTGPTIDKQRLAHLLDQLAAYNKAGADRRGHKDYDDREVVLDEMQTMLGLGMVMVNDIVTKANKVLGRV